MSIRHQRVNEYSPFLCGRDQGYTNTNINTEYHVPSYKKIKLEVQLT